MRVIGYNCNTTGTYGCGAFNANTYATPTVGGSTDAAVLVDMFKTNGAAGREAIDARQALGSDWQEIVAAGAPQTCN